MDIVNVSYLEEGDITDWVSMKFIQARALMGSIYAAQDPSVVGAIDAAEQYLQTYGLFIRNAKVEVLFNKNEIYFTKYNSLAVYRKVYPMTGIGSMLELSQGGSLPISNWDNRAIYLSERTLNRSVNLYAEDLGSIKMTAGYEKGKVDKRLSMLLGYVFTSFYEEREAYQSGEKEIVQSPAFQGVFKSIIQDNGGINKDTITILSSG